MHGALDQVECLQCGAISPRAVLQERLREANAEWVASLGPTLPTELRADGDSEIADAEDTFAIPSCERCGDGVLKPGVVFFGGSLPKHVVDAAGAWIARHARQLAHCEAPARNGREA